MPTASERIEALRAAGRISDQEAADLLAALVGEETNPRSHEPAATQPPTPPPTPPPTTPSDSASAGEATEDDRPSADKAEHREHHQEPGRREQGGEERWQHRHEDHRHEYGPHDHHDRQGRHWRHQRHGRHHRHGDFGDDLRETLRAAFRVGMEALKESQRGMATGATQWLNSSNHLMMSEAQTPTGSRYRCEDNSATVSSLVDLRFEVGEFMRNQLRAASISGLSLNEGVFRDQQINGSSLRGVDVVHSVVRDCQFNGTSLTKILLRASQLSDSRFNGANLRDVAAIDSHLSALKFNGGDLRDVEFMDRTRIEGWALKGASIQGLEVRQSEWKDVVMTALRVRDLEVLSCQFDNVEVSFRDWRWQGRQGLRDTQFRNLKLKSVEFSNCNFDGTVIADCDLDEVYFDSVDFSGLTLIGNEQLLRYARRAERSHG